MIFKYLGNRNSDELASLVDMTVERDVCDFLVESGCMELIVGSVSASEDVTGIFHRIRTVSTLP